jgi:hypothetical protein
VSESQYHLLHKWELHHADLGANKMPQLPFSGDLVLEVHSVVVAHTKMGWMEKTQWIRKKWIEVQHLLEMMKTNQCS